MREVFIVTARRFGKQAFAREAAAAAATERRAAERKRRAAARDRAYAAVLRANPEGNNRNKGAAPIGRVSVKTHRRQRQNHSHATKPSY